MSDYYLEILNLKEAKDLFAAYGKFSEGSTATKNRPGWWTKCKK